MFFQNLITMDVIRRGRSVAPAMMMAHDVGKRVIWVEVLNIFKSWMVLDMSLAMAVCKVVDMCIYIQIYLIYIYDVLLTNCHFSSIDISFRRKTRSKVKIRGAVTLTYPRAYARRILWCSSGSSRERRE
jgi:hypothetical protein